MQKNTSNFSELLKYDGEDFFDNQMKNNIIKNGWVNTYTYTSYSFSNLNRVFILGTKGFSKRLKFGR